MKLWLTECTYECAETGETLSKENAKKNYQIIHKTITKHEKYKWINRKRETINVKRYEYICKRKPEQGQLF